MSSVADAPDGAAVHVTPSASEKSNKHANPSPPAADSSAASVNALPPTAATTTTTTTTATTSTTESAEQTSPQSSGSSGSSGLSAEESPEQQSDSSMSKHAGVRGGGGDGVVGAGEMATNADALLAASQPAKRRKVDHACVYCRRSHMTCDSGRPCSRCVKRNIGHLCRDESKDLKQRTETSSPPPLSVGGTWSESGEGLKVERRRNEDEDTHVEYQTAGVDAVAAGSRDEFGAAAARTTSAGTTSMLLPLPAGSTSQLATTTSNNAGGTTTSSGTATATTTPTASTNLLLANLTPYQTPLFFSEHAGSEFSSLTDFLTMLEEVPPVPVLVTEAGAEASALDVVADPLSVSANELSAGVIGQVGVGGVAVGGNAVKPLSARGNGNLTLTTETKPLQVPETAKDKFFLTAADPADGPERTAEERLKQVINAKLEAGLLAPFNYVKGYARLQRYMDRHMSAASRQRILKPLSIFRPAFRAIAQTLIDVDLVLVEEAFERMLLDYDRVFTSMAIPACLWRRTGEIYRGNKEFGALVEVPVEELRDGRLAIYELLSEDSAVNYWEKYGNIAFDSGQKAVLTSCTLRSRDGTRRSCCFSFTIRRDRYNIPSCIIGNFIPIHS
ncbi:uncharacterized protein V1518DRAFT_428642 [Limtongia smithiae]|uniref:uncharacterized protein n=1 Tax=Limtongia smithiae TaxID=1125753 RepID=UPI0034CDBEF9